MTITYTAEESIVQNASFEISDDLGETWYTLMTSGYMTLSDPNWGTYKVVLPATIEGVPLGGKEWKLRVRDYDIVYVVEMVGTFTVNSSATATGGTAARGRLHLVPLGGSHGGQYSVRAPARERFTVELMQPNGRVLARVSGMGPEGAAIDLSDAGTGLYLLRVTSGRASLTRRVYMTR
jgi:hypothetical protein